MKEKCKECGFVSGYGNENYHSFDCSKNKDFNTTTMSQEYNVEEIVDKAVQAFKKKTIKDFEEAGVSWPQVILGGTMLAIAERQLRKALTSLHHSHTEEVEQARKGGRKAWIQGNVISFEKPTYNSAFFDAEEVIVFTPINTH